MGGADRGEKVEGEGLASGESGGGESEAKRRERKWRGEGCIERGRRRGSGGKKRRLCE